MSKLQPRYLHYYEMRVIQAMGVNLERLKKLWGEEFEPLVTLIAWATAPQEDRLTEIVEAVEADPKKPTLLLLTERDDDPRQYSVAATIAHECKRLNNPVHVLFTGGNYYTGMMAEYGEEAATAMLARFLAMAPDMLPFCSMDQGSKHTGHQGLYIGGVIRAHRYKRVIAVVPTVHVVRFMLTYNYDLRQLGLTDIEQFAVGIGEWDRMLRRRLTQAEEAFDPILDTDDPRLISGMKRIGAEYGERLYPEICEDPGKWCPAEKPSVMCRRLGLITDPERGANSPNPGSNAP